MSENVMTEQEAIEALKKYMKDTGKKQIEVVKELDVSSSLLSSFLSGTYAAPHTVIPKIQELLRAKEKKKVVPRDPEYTETSISRIVLNAIEHSHTNHKVAVVYGDAGVGKTMAFQQYLKENSLAIGITISPVFSSIIGVNELLAEQMGIKEHNSRKMTLEMITKLRGSGRVIIVDEAQHLTIKTLEHLRSTAEAAGVGLCLIGNHKIYRRMKGTGAADFSQLFSRMAITEPVMTIDITREDVERIFGRYEVDEESMEMLYRISQTNYGLRGAVNVFVNTAGVFEEITAANLTRIIRSNHIEV